MKPDKVNEAGAYILKNTPLLGGIPADVIWGKYEKGKRKGSKCKKM